MTKYMNNDYLLRKTRILQDSGIQQTPSKSQPIPKSGQPSFEEVMSKIGQKELKFSKHALDRMKSRNIELTQQDLDKISEAVDKADNKGIKEALILMNNKVFIASVKSKTIITAAAEDQLKDSVFTNIDGAVIV